MASGATDTSDVRSAQRVLSILLFLASRAAPVPAAAIARACSLPRSSTYHLLKILSARGFVMYCADERAWGLDAAAFEMATAYVRSQPLESIGRPVLRELSATSEEVAHLAVLHGQDVLYLLKEQPPRLQLRLVTEIGVRLPAHRTAVGRAMLMHLPPAQLRALYPPEQPARAVRREQVLLPTELERTLRRERSHGYSIDDGETTAGVACIGAAVFDHRSQPAAAVNVTFVSARHGIDSRYELAGQVRAAADRISQMWRAQAGASSKA